ncbi:hypothetical protein BaRGS_00008876 [Batillaria attramentaria]|uniref:Uncharacterized protein n=1 Tax=Batillaria attramentaria TaxID=370345 RepID=A0ABD0LK44_9CAEN
MQPPTSIKHGNVKSQRDHLGCPDKSVMSPCARRLGRITLSLAPVIASPAVTKDLRRNRNPALYFSQFKIVGREYPGVSHSDATLATRLIKLSPDGGVTNPQQTSYPLLMGRTGAGGRLTILKIGSQASRHSLLQAAGNLSQCLNPFMLFSAPGGHLPGE